jgi:hypothetical protein
LKSIGSTKTRTIFLPLLRFILKRNTFGSKFHGVCLMEDTAIGTMRRLVEVDEDFVSMVRFVMKKSWKWRCRGCDGEDTQKH